MSKIYIATFSESQMKDLKKVAKNLIKDSSWRFDLDLVVDNIFKLILSSENNLITLKK